MGTVCCNENPPSNQPAYVTKKVVQHPPPVDRSEPQSHPEREPTSIAAPLEQPVAPRRGAENYQSIKYLGRGTFGDVVLAEDKETSVQYAMKIIDKRKIKEFNVLQSERIRKISEQPLFASIRETFQNESKIYIVMEYLPKGDIYYYLRKKQCEFTEDIIRMLVSEIIVGIELLHAEGIIYRELKPENILVTNDGHVKLTDYGLSKLIVGDKDPISTFIGTLQYTAPEALRGNYGKKVDIWAIGVLMFELKFTHNIFENNQCASSTSEQIQMNIEKTNIEEALNEHVKEISYNFRQVLIKLLEKDPEARISLEQLKKHPFFEGIDWGQIPERKNPPPMKRFLETDHIKFRDPTNEKELAHRKFIENKNSKGNNFKAKLYEFRASE